MQLFVMDVELKKLEPKFLEYLLNGNVFFYFTLIIFCFLHYANIDQTNNGDYFDFYKKEDFLDIIWMFCVEIFIAPLIIASPIPYFFSRGKKSTISYSWYR